MPDSLPRADMPGLVDISGTPVTAAALHETEADRNTVFTSLVRENNDIAGLVAYSIYKQNKLDWLQAFEKGRGRAPNEAEQAAYIIGESTPRRLATYRFLAEATLAGQAPDQGLADPSKTAAFRPFRDDGRSKSSFAPSVFAYGLLAVVILVGVFFFARYGLTTPHP